MTNKELFIKEIDELIAGTPLSSSAMSYYEALKVEPSRAKTDLTEMGAKILVYMNEAAPSCNNTFTAKAIGEGLFISSRSASGAMKKLITDGYVNKVSDNPVTYEITEEGCIKATSI